MLISRIMFFVCVAIFLFVFPAAVIFWSSYSDQTLYTLLAISAMACACAAMLNNLALHQEYEVLQKMIERSHVQRGLQQILKNPRSKDEVKNIIHAGLYPQDERPLLLSQIELMGRRDVPDFAPSNISKKV